MKFDQLRLFKYMPELPEKWLHTNWIWRAQSIMSQYGIIRVENAPDIVVTSQYIPPEQYLDHPIVFENTNDATSFQSWHWDLLRMENTKSHLRNQVFRNPEVCYRRTNTGDYYGHVWESRQTGQPPDRSLRGFLDPCLDKTKLILPLTMPPGRMSFARTANSPKLKDRELDFFFSGRLNYQHPPPFPQKQRYQLKHLWDDLPGEKFWKGTSIWASGLPYFEYLEKLCQTKIAISPWGWGAWNIRDYEALLCGCVLVKPECSGLKIIPDIYDPKELLCHMCNVDLSNLVPMCQSILQHLDEFQPLVDRGRQLMEEYFDPPDHFIHTWCKEMLAVGNAL